MSYITLNGDIYIRPVKKTKKSFQGLNMGRLFQKAMGWYRLLRDI